MGYKHIELFAGCGGMSLGLEAAGFDLFMANELSPMAAETFAYNILNENLSEKSQNKVEPFKTLWIKSKYPKSTLNLRLRENPFDFEKGKYYDIDSDTNFYKKLLIGNIDHLLDFLSKNNSVVRKLKRQNIDLLSGGPPCQGFSLVGKRIKDDQKNSLPLSFSKFAGILQPKVVLLENVRGITSPFTANDGKKHFAWLEVAKAFALEGFIPVCMLLNSKYFNIPQNRPRFVLFAFRKDIFNRIRNLSQVDENLENVLSNSFKFYCEVRSCAGKIDDINLGNLKIYDMDYIPNLFNGFIFPKITNTKDNFITAGEGIDDISSTSKEYIVSKIKSKYPNYLSLIFKNRFKNYFLTLQNHERRNHRFEVKARFRLFQILNGMNGLRFDAEKVISGRCKDEKTSREIFKYLKGEKLLLESDEEDVFGYHNSFQSFEEYLANIRTKKHSQRALKKEEPSPAQMTIPDDLCHYSPHELRTLTVREMARFQSFPDWFVFRGKVTTGSIQRSYEVPQYTQVGNAVPPLMAFEIGQAISKVLQGLKKSKTK